MIELSHVTKTFGGKKALDELSLRVPQGAVYGLIGSNGAGKSTAIRHLTGIYRPDAGTVTIGGLPVYENPEIKSRIGYIPGRSGRARRRDDPRACGLLPRDVPALRRGPL